MVKAFMVQKLSLVLFVFTFFTAHPARAEITLYDQNSWQVKFGGFVELDTFYDTTRSFTEVVGAAPVARKGTLDGENGRTQFSIRNTRLSVNVIAPEVSGWKSNGYIETDFLGYDPSVNSSGTSNSESGFYTSPSLRVRHAYVLTKKDDWNIIFGQTWNLFGWQPQYVLATLSVNPVSGTLYQRSERIGVLRAIRFNDQQELNAAISLQRPSQRDGKVPDLDFGIKFSDKDDVSGFSGATSTIIAQPMSIGVSGTFREFEIPSSGSVTQETDLPAFAIAVNTNIPILKSSDGKSVAHTLTAVGEFTAGRGYGDEFSNSGEVAQLNTSAGSSVNIDPGLGGYNANGGFELVKLMTWNTQLQYHLDGISFFTVGYSNLWASNAGDFIGGAGETNTKIYDRLESKFVNFVHDFSAQIRVGIEFDQFTTHYALDQSVNHDNRYLMASYFRF
jgi:hypothetical protein